MARAKNYPSFRGPGAGRPPKAETPPCLKTLMVEGRIQVRLEDAETFEKIGRLRDAAGSFGLVVHLLDRTGRKSWGAGRVSIEAAEKFVVEHPGVSFLRWAEDVFLAGDPLNEVTFGAAKAKARVALSKLFREGVIDKRRDSRGVLTLWPANAPPDTGAIPPDFLLDLRRSTKAAIEEARRGKKAVSTLALVLEAAEKTWALRAAGGPV